MDLEALQLPAGPRFFPSTASLTCRLRAAPPAGILAPPMTKYLFTPETARLASVKAHEARRRQRAARTTAGILATVQPLPDDAAPDGYLRARLACVRAQLERVDAMLLTESDPQRLDRLAAASSRLAEQERVLAGRPAPGAYRPSAPRRRVESTPLLPE